MSVSDIRGFLDWIARVTRISLRSSGYNHVPLFAAELPGTVAILVAVCR